VGLLIDVSWSMFAHSGRSGTHRPRVGAPA